MHQFDLDLYSVTSIITNRTGYFMIHLFHVPAATSALRLSSYFCLELTNNIRISMTGEEEDNLELNFVWAIKMFCGAASHRRPKLKFVATKNKSRTHLSNTFFHVRFFASVPAFSCLSGSIISRTKKICGVLLY